MLSNVYFRICAYERSELYSQAFIMIFVYVNFSDKMLLLVYGFLEARVVLRLLARGARIRRYELVEYTNTFRVSCIRILNFSMVVLLQLRSCSTWYVL
jgi:hypothetical protein